MFFAAFLPQFVDPSGPAGPQIAVLGVVFGVMAACSDSVWALGATGRGMMIALGVTLVAADA